jgi:hypothetical protein
MSAVKKASLGGMTVVSAVKKFDLADTTVVHPRQNSFTADTTVEICKGTQAKLSFTNPI